VKIVALQLKSDVGTLRTIALTTEWYSLGVRLRDLAGLSVLDLTCGDGMGTRLIKHWGAGEE
jgi:hypothetical protein